MIAKQLTPSENPPCARELRHVGALTRCASIVQDFRPGLTSVERVEHDSLHVEVAYKDGNQLSRGELERLGRSLALQLGLEVFISNDRRVANHDTAALMPNQPSGPALTEQPDSSSVVVAPTVFTVLLQEPYSNVYSAIPADILARLHANQVIQGAEPTILPTEAPAIVRMKSVLQKFSVSMHGVKCHSFSGFTHLVIDATPDIVEEEVFYELSQELAKVTCGKGLVITVAPSKIPANDVSEAVLPKIPDLEVKAVPSASSVEEHFTIEHTPQAIAFCAKLREEIGTSHPYNITFDQAAGQYIVQILYKKNLSKAHEDLALRIAQIASNFEVPAAPAFKHAARNSLILNHGKRSNISHHDMLKMADLLWANLHLSDDSEWLRINPSRTAPTAYGNCIEITPLLGLTETLFEAIKDAAAHIPAPILLHRVHSTQEPLSAAAVKSLTKMLLPPWASLHSIRASASGKVAVTILASRSSWVKLHKELTAAFKSIDPNVQKIIFHREERHGRICQALTERSDVYRKIFIRNMNSDGIISISEWKANLSKASEDATISLQELKDLHPGIIDRTDLPVSLWDIEGTSRAEDGQSLVIKDGILTHGIHFANAAIQLDEFSAERHQAYRRGDSLYVRDGPLAMVSHMLPALGRQTFQTGVVSPALSLFIDYKLSALNDPVAVSRGIANARLEPTFIRPSSAYLYPREESAEWRSTLPKVARNELALISEIGQALGRHSSDATIWSATNSLDPGSHIKSMLYLANHILAKTLQESGLPCLYQGTEIPSHIELNMFLEAIRTHQAALPELRSFATFTAEDLASDPKHLHQIYSIVRIFPRAKRELCRFPLFRSTVGTTPQAHLFSGYAPFVKTNTGFRRLPSLVAQHQLNAHLGLVAPLSRGEINSILKQHIRHYESGIDKKIESDLCLIGLLRYLKRCQHNPMSAVAIAAPQDGFAKVRIELPFRVPLRCLAALRPQDQDTLRIGDPLHVVPAHYSLPENTLLFKRVR